MVYKINLAMDENPNKLFHVYESSVVPVKDDLLELITDDDPTNVKHVKVLRRMLPTNPTQTQNRFVFCFVSNI